MATISGKGQASVLSNQDIDRVIELAAKKYKGIFAIAAFTGCRISEARLMTADRLDLSRRTLTFTNTKTGIDRDVPISDSLYRILLDLELPSAGYLFPSPRTAGALSLVCISDELRAIAKDMGLVGVSTHSFRRSLATTLSRENIPLKVIAAITGHKSLDQLSRYLEVTEADKAVAVNALNR